MTHLPFEHFPEGYRALHTFFRVHHTPPCSPSRSSRRSLCCKLFDNR